MKTTLIKIGNSQGLRLPKPIIEQLGFTDDIEMEVKSDHLVLRAAKKNPREGWAEQAALLHAQGGDVLLDADILPSHFDDVEWQW